MTDAKRRIDVAEAVALIAANMPRFGVDKVPLAQAQGAILRQAVVAERDQPPFDRVTMDGIAIRHAGFASGTRRFEVRGTQAAGAASLSLDGDDNCIEIMTGAALPDDADTVIPVERIRRDGDFALLEDGYEPAANQFIHRRGSDHPADARLLEPGTIIGAPEMAVLTSGGAGDVDIARWPNIAVISTGDELIDVGEPISRFQIRSSNDRAIAAALERRGCRTATRARLADNPEQLLTEIDRLHKASDIMVLSGGVSMGKYDYVPQIMEQLGMRLVFHKILQRPGLPMWFGVSADDKPVFALPGNPVSSLVCLARYVTPAILTAMGIADRPIERVPLAEDMRFDFDLTRFIPVVFSTDDAGLRRAVPRAINTSGDFTSLAGTDGIIELMREQEHFPAGYAAPFFAW